MKRFQWWLLLLSASSLVLFGPLSARAQSNSDDDIEALFSAEDEAAEKATVTERKTKDQEGSGKSDAKSSDASSVQTTVVKDLSDLAKLSPFDDVAVIQRRFLPKTGRFELFAGGSGVLNDAFFLGLGAVARGGYYFRERWGIEALVMMLSTSEKTITTDLRKDRGVLTESLITVKSYYGVDVKWSPIYGKMAYHNRGITPFDLYFSLGGGFTGTNQGGSEPTLHVGTGQIFALSKSMAVRWDFSWNFFSGDTKVTTRSATGVASTKTESSMYNNLFLTVGMSFFFPEATYR